MAVDGVTDEQGRSDSWDYYFIAEDDWFVVHAPTLGDWKGELLGPTLPDWQRTSRPVTLAMDSDEAARLALQARPDLGGRELLMTLHGEGREPAWCVSPSFKHFSDGRALVNESGRGAWTQPDWRCGFAPVIWPLRECGALQADVDALAPEATAGFTLHHRGHESVTVTASLQDTGPLGGDVHLEFVGPDGKEAWDLKPGETANRTIAPAPPGDYSVQVSLTSQIRQEVSLEWASDILPVGRLDWGFCT
jgi:hypothetical protein